MSIIGWIVLGFISGFVGGKILTKSNGGLLPEIILGLICAILGAFIGGFLLVQYGGGGMNSFNLVSAVIAFTGALAVLVAYYLRSHARSQVRPGQHQL